MTAQTGFNRSGNLATTFGDRPSLKAGASIDPVLGSPNKWFDPTAFFLPPQGTYGNLGRNTLIGPGLGTFDLSLVRHFPIGNREGMGFDFRAEAFNLFNRANFGLPALRIFNSSGQILGTVGVITTTVTSSRQLQLGVKFKF